MPLRGDTTGRPLSPREIEVLAAYARTGSYKDAATEVGMAPQTARNHLSRSHRKLNVTSTVEAFYRLGWLTPPDAEGQEREAAAHRLADLRQRAAALAREVRSVCRSLPRPD